ncbi:MAG: GNAT family N-acetyltransferase [Actinomycetota bacterium]|nr:GNAT family N-acetyltransferase [Actinomycetota bacterium]
MEVHPVRADELDDAARVVLAAYQALPGAHMTDGYATELTDLVSRSKQAEVLVATEAAVVVGCVTLVPDPASPWAEQLGDGEVGLRMMAVDPAHQRQGIAQVLLDACVDRAVELGRRTVFLHSTPWMTAAHRLYQRNGFVRAPERDWLPGPDVPLLAFRLDLEVAGRPGGRPGFPSRRTGNS